MEYKYVIGMARKSDGAIFLARSGEYTRDFGVHTSGTRKDKQFGTYADALEEVKRLAGIRSEDYEYLVLKVVASAKIASKPIEVTEY